MRRRIVAGIGAGLVAGVVFGVVMRGLPATAADGGRISMVAFAGQLIHAGNPLMGWLAYVVYGIALGVLFGASFVVATTSALRTALLGAVWGVGWFVVVGLGLVPALLGDRPFSAGALQTMRNIGVPLLIGHVVYGLVLGVAFNVILNALTPPGSSGRAQSGIRRAA